jgi:hypothetical protein
MRCEGWDMPMVAQPLGELPTLAILFLRKLPKVCGPFSAPLVVRMHNGCEAIGISQSSQSSQRFVPMN